MRVDLTANEFVALAHRMNELQAASLNGDYTVEVRILAQAERHGMQQALELLGFVVTVDARGRVMDIAQR